MRLDVRETVNVIVRTFPGASSVLRRHGLDDLLWWAGTPLDEACRAQGIDVEVVAEEIVRQVDPDVAHAFKARPAGQQAAAPRPKAAVAAPVASRAWEPPPSIVAMLADPEEPREDVMPDVAQVYRARPGHAHPEDEDVVEVAPPAPPPTPVDEPMPDVAQVFRVRAGTPDAPFLHAHKEPEPVAPPPEPPQQVGFGSAYKPPALGPIEPVADEPDTEEPAPELVAGLIQQAVAAGLQWASSDSAEPDVEGLRARRRELQRELQELLALRDQALGKHEPPPLDDDDDGDPVSEIFDDEDPPQQADEPVSEIFDDVDDELDDLVEEDPPQVEVELAESLDTPPEAEAAPEEDKSWVTKVKSWFAA